MSDRRQRIHELVLALIQRQEGLELLDGDGQGLGAGLRLGHGSGQDPANWLERNRRLVQRYQALVRTAITLDALIDQEVAGQL
jgi:hypothetical protein